MTKLNISQAKSHLSKLLDLAIQGEEIVITQDDKPVAKISLIRFYRTYHANNRLKPHWTRIEAKVDKDQSIKNSNPYRARGFDETY